MVLVSCWFFLLAHCYWSSVASSNVTLGKELNTESKIRFGLMMVKLQWEMKKFFFTLLALG